MTIKIRFSLIIGKRATSPLLGVILLVGLAAILFAGLAIVMIPMSQGDINLEIVELEKIDKNSDSLIDHLFITLQNIGFGRAKFSQIDIPIGWHLESQPSSLSFNIGELKRFKLKTNSVQNQLWGNEDFSLVFRFENSNDFIISLSNFNDNPREYIEGKWNIADGNLIEKSNNGLIESNNKAKRSGIPGVILHSNNTMQGPAYLRTTASDTTTIGRAALEGEQLNYAAEIIDLSTTPIIGFWIRSDSFSLGNELQVTFQLFNGNQLTNTHYVSISEYSTGWQINKKLSTDYLMWQLVLIDFREIINIDISDVSTYFISFLSFEITNQGEWLLYIDDMNFFSGF
ncbi:MAG: hypothetical protein ACXAC7_04225 [Candidatus Hodarchaeales archaeon]|jgi:hypothetical protein